MLLPFSPRMESSRLESDHPSDSRLFKEVSSRYFVDSEIFHASLASSSTVELLAAEWMAFLIRT